MPDADDNQPERPEDRGEDAAEGSPNEEASEETGLSGVLAEIVAHKRREVAERKSKARFQELEGLVAQAEPPRNFFRAVTRTGGAMTAVIAEVKRRSPSAGLIREEYAGPDFAPEDIARAYEQNGAAAISVLTDADYFGGDLSYINRVKRAVSLPVIRKDFIIDPWQLWESRAAGADAVLLIAECLREAEIVDMLILSQQLQMTVLLEVHSMENLLRVRPHIGFPHPTYCLLGINNRDLANMTTDLTHTTRLVDLVDDTSVLVSESGIKTSDDLHRLRASGVRIVLVGEHLMRQPEPGAALAELLSSPAPGTIHPDKP
jgi:indole-3-glycerol phosphate synthase